MILAIDIGNTTVTLGGVRIAPQQAYSLEFTARIDINHTWSASQYESAIEQLFEDKNLSPSDFRGVIISSVVPSVLTLLQECVRNLFGTEPLLVTSESDLGMTFSIPEPEKVGRDRLVDAAWAAAHYPLPVITVDLGTATTFNVIRENSVFCGGAIAPGLDMGLGALSERTAQLPRLDLQIPKRIIGRNTEECILSGTIVGMAAMLDGMVHHTVRTRTQFSMRKGSGTFFVYRRFCGKSTQSGKQERIKAGYYRGDGILPLFCGIKFALGAIAAYVRTESLYISGEV